jgi:hypothetical protein
MLVRDERTALEHEVLRREMGHQSAAVSVRLTLREAIRALAQLAGFWPAKATANPRLRRCGKEREAKSL